MQFESKDVMVVELEPEVHPFAEEIESANEPPAESLTTHHPALAYSQGAVQIGTLAAWDDAGNPLVDFPKNPSECLLPARSTVPLKPTDRGREVALLFAGDDVWQPLIIGLLQPAKGAPTPESRPALAAEIDGERLVLTAKQEIVLQCGQASLTLTRAGKVLIRGAYVLSRSSGVNRIKGGSVQIN
ncbi:MAG TPA: DUF6484 domain-containing protein [Gemmataceae bacterium]|nr:DUF6484 domain-containing protein [Gemmataceae bacterium]